MLENINNAALRAAEIVKGLLVFSGKYYQQSDLTVDIREVMDNALKMAYNDYSLKNKYDMKKIKIIKPYEDIPLVKCDPIKIQQVFLNIIKNGTEAMAGIENPEFLLRIYRDSNVIKSIL